VGAARSLPGAGGHDRRRLTLLQAGYAVNAFGAGLVLPFQVIYLHDVRGLSLGVTGVVVSVLAATALLGGFVCGSLTDRFGVRVPAAAASIVSGFGFAGFALVHGPAVAFVSAFVAGLGVGGLVASRSALVVAVADQADRHGAFAVQFAVINLGVAVGAAAGGAIADTSSPGTFVALFLGNAATSVAFGLLLVAVVPASRPAAHEARAHVRYRELLRHRAILGFAALTVVFAAAGIAVYEVGLPLYARNVALLSEGEIGFLFLLNSAVIVCAQLPVARALQGRDRLHVIAGALALWALGWAAVAFGDGRATATAGLWLFVPVVVLFALGECLIAPIQGGLVVDLAPEAIQGRALALASNAYGVGLTLGPPLVTFLLALSSRALWIAAAAVLALSVAAALALDRAVPERARRVPLAAST
jgi:MFS family permease